jgi:hypothetical protein
LKQRLETLGRKFMGRLAFRERRTGSTFLGAGTPAFRMWHRICSVGWRPAAPERRKEQETGTHRGSGGDDWEKAVLCV